MKGEREMDANEIVRKTTKQLFMPESEIPECCTDCNMCNDHEGICELTMQDIDIHIRCGTRSYMCPARVGVSVNDWEKVENSLFEADNEF